MCGSGFLAREKAGTFHDDIDVQFFPWKVFRITVADHTNPVAIDNQIIPVNGHVSRKFAMSGIVLGQESNSVDTARIVDGNNFNIMMLAVFIMSALEDAVAMAVDCLAGYLYTAKMDNEKFPKASKLSDINIDRLSDELGITGAYTDAFTNMVSVDVKAYAKEHFDKSVRKTLTIPAWLNTAAQEEGINFSKTLQEALMSKLKAH